jgi:hypothetical protein
MNSKFFYDGAGCGFRFIIVETTIFLYTIVVTIIRLMGG